MDEKFRRLIELGAGEFEHVDGSLIAHLEGTRCLLKEWNASEILQNAALYHAAYGTLAFSHNVFDLTQRDEVAAVIGEAAEQIVYHYFACDRDAFFKQFGNIARPVYYDRITNQKVVVSDELIQQLCELSAANETEIALNNPDFVTEHGCELVDLFSRMQDFLSPSAKRKIQHVFAACF
ncbi:DUF6817 domain-containing protein [Paraglaciecola arctica]|uniref:DUF6817 domain-containing protein n=1 Tax=Paraglaciecola arctica TaxID=1128911 RepID=UPI001C066B1A|nr:hypothetical protein [Paraglaciecola arctica]MBU3002904.1 hypothetical protein [Paraglaciecola arctica]